MAKTKISELGSSVCVDDQDEKMIPALGNGALKPGDLCFVDPSNGRVKGSDAGAQEFFQGILMESKITGPDTAIVTDIPCKLVVPKSGHSYRIGILAADDTDEAGTGVTFSATPGKAETTDVTLANSKLGRLGIEVLVGDEVAEIVWIE